MPVVYVLPLCERVHACTATAVVGNQVVRASLIEKGPSLREDMKEGRELAKEKNVSGGEHSQRKSVPGVME